jgi:hypothetical protein
LSGCRMFCRERNSRFRVGRSMMKGAEGGGPDGRVCGKMV